jgi:hypothetical protein
MHGSREQLLEYLYDLLEPHEHQALQAHLADCAECRAALEKAQGDQRLLACAARMPFPNVRFEPPTEKPDTLPLRPARPQRRRWRRFAVAAAILLTLAGLGAPGLWMTRDYHQAQGVVVQHNQEIAADRNAVRQLDAKQAEIAEKRNQDIDSVKQTINEREVRVVVRGPSNVQSGVAAEYLVRTVDLNGQPTDAHIAAYLDLREENRTKSRGLIAANGKGSARKADDASAPKLAEKKSDRFGEAPGTPSASYSGTGSTSNQFSAPSGAGALGGVGGGSGFPRTAPVPPAVGAPTPVSAPTPNPITTAMPAAVPVAPAPQAAPVPLPGFMPTSGTTDPGASAKADDRGSDKDQFNRDLSSNPKNKQKDAERQKAGDLAHTPLSVERIAKGEYRVRVLPTAGLQPDAELVVSAERANGPKMQFNERVRITRPVYLTHLTTDRSTYAPGDTVRFRSLTVDRSTLEPTSEDFRFSYTVTTPTGETRDILRGGNNFVRAGRSMLGAFDKKDAKSQPILGIGTGEYPLAAQAPSGEYTLTVSEEANRFPSETRRFRVGAPTPLLVVNKPQGEAKPDRPLVEFFPEGGDLIAGLPNRVYFQARTPAGKPIRLHGALVENNQALPLSVTTLHDDRETGVNQGTGVFTFTPQIGRKYELRIDSPATAIGRIPLPPVREEGVALHLAKGVFEPNEPIPVSVPSNRPRSLVIGAYCRGQLLDAVEAEPGQTQVTLHPSTGIGGVCRVTVFEELPGNSNRPTLHPLAERLFFRRPAERLDVSIKPDARRYDAGTKVNLSLATTDETEKLKPSIMMVAVTQRDGIDRNAPSLPTHFLLTTEVRRPEDLEHADFFLGPHPKAAEALDLLLGTQGWRRFAEQSPAEFRARLEHDAEHLSAGERRRSQEEAERLLLLTGRSSPRTTDFDQQRIDRASAVFAEQSADLGLQRKEVSERLASAAQNPDYQQALSRVESYEHMFNQLRSVSKPLLLGLLALTAVVLVIVGLRHSGWRGLPWHIGTLVAVCIVVLLVRTPSVREEPAATIADAPVPTKLSAAARAPIATEPQSDPKKEAKPDAADAAPAPLDPAQPSEMPRLASRALNADRPAEELASSRGEKEHLRKDSREGYLESAKGTWPEAKRLALDQGRGAAVSGPMAREYAHAAGKSPTSGTETLCWQPALVLPDGRVELSFLLNDAPTPVQVIAVAHTPDGRLGAATMRLEVQPAPVAK